MVQETDWGRYERYVMASLDELKSETKILREDVQTIKEGMAGLKVRSGLWGAAAAMLTVGVPVGLGLLAILLK